MRGNSTIVRFSGAPVSRHQRVARRAVDVAPSTSACSAVTSLTCDAALDRARERRGEPAVADVRHLDGQRLTCAASISASRWLIIGQLRLAVRLAAVDEEVDAARRIELVVAGHALAQARDVLVAFDLDHHVDPLVAVVVADAHRAERDDSDRR